MLSYFLHRIKIRVNLRYLRAKKGYNFSSPKSAPSAFFCGKIIQHMLQYFSHRIKIRVNLRYLRAKKGYSLSSPKSALLCVIHRRKSLQKSETQQMNQSPMRQEKIPRNNPDSPKRQVIQKDKRQGFSAPQIRIEWKQ